MLIPLTKGLFAKVDSADLPVIGAYKWHAHSPKISGFYAVASPTDRRSNILMHRLIMQAAPGQKTDHINGDGLDNRRVNLRACSAAENARNRRKPTDGSTSSLYKGVARNTARKKWVAYIKLDGDQRHLGYFSSETDAAVAYDAAAKELFGDFAFLNFPNGVAHLPPIATPTSGPAASRGSDVETFGFLVDARQRDAVGPSFSSPHPTE